MTKIQSLATASHPGFMPCARSRSSRHIPLGSGRSFKGALVAEIKNRPTAVVFESRLELLTAYKLLANPDVVDLQDQPAAVDYIDLAGRKRSHVFDFLAVMKSGKRIAVAVKPANSAEKHDLRKTLGLIRAQNPGFADEFELVTNQSFSRIDALNAELIHSLRYERDDEADQAVMSLIQTIVTTCSIGDVVRQSELGSRGFRAIVRAIGRGECRQTNQGLLRNDAIIARKGAV